MEKRTREQCENFLLALDSTTIGKRKCFRIEAALLNRSATPSRRCSPLFPRFLRARLLFPASGSTGSAREKAPVKFVRARAKVKNERNLARGS